ncbi:hypothetical protein [Billgrantia endophytica]|uniref:hypothetical protein n=1 Tax=Billgrantia endophytica TaxID=2033802 RepID=UPI001F0C673A|nr:hypothetical protein [Halomonas endophytica]
MIMGYLSRLAGRGMNITAYWRNAQDPLTEQVIGFRAGHAAPEVRVYLVREVPEENEPNDGITLVMADHVELLPSIGADHDLDLLAHHPRSRADATPNSLVFSTLPHGYWSRLIHQSIILDTISPNQSQTTH